MSVTIIEGMTIAGGNIRGDSDLEFVDCTFLPKPEHRAWPSESGRVPGCTCWAEPCCESCGEPWPCPDARG